MAGPWRSGGRAVQLLLPGFISYELWRGKDGEALTIANFESEEAVSNWREQAGHRAAQERGRAEFYQKYSVQVCTTVREYDWEKPA